MVYFYMGDDTKTVEEYNKLRKSGKIDAANKLKLRQASISRVCTKNRKTYKGLIFMFYDEYLKINNIENEEENNGV